jgi:lipopolysaccharide biosynthesis regulator YciM
MLILLWLLLPIAAASGWYLAKREHQQQSSNPPYALPQDYYKGLNYILNEQPDKAIDLFLKLSELDTGTLEIHLALGSLFRRRGEVDRAIRLHQGLVNQPSLSNDLYIHALHELTLDYMSAGLLDRAENLCLELVDVDSRNLAALHLLQEIYQQEKEWFRAIEMARKISACSTEIQSHIIANYYCELASDARKKGDMTQARRMLDKALYEDPACGRAVIILGDIERGLGNFVAAISCYQQLEVAAPEYLSEILPSLLACYEGMGEPLRMVIYLKQIIHKHHAVELVLTATRIMKKHEGEDAALNFLMREVSASPSLRGVQCLLELDINREEKDNAGRLRVIKESLDKLLANKPVYRCVSCGFTGMEMHWCCPGCKRWSSVKPIQEFQWGASI